MKYMFLLLLCSCSAQYYELKAEERRYRREYDWDKVGYRTPLNRIHVQPPAWLAGGDVAPLLRAVDATVEKMRDLSADCKDFDFHRVVVWIHEAPRYVSPQGVWVTGQRLGNRVTVSFVGDTIWSLAHELFHIVFDDLYNDKTHGRFDATVVAAVRQRVEFSEASKTAQDAWVYRPWLNAK